MTTVKERDDGIIFRFATPDDRAEVYQFAWNAIAAADLPKFAEDAGENLQNRIEEGDPTNVLIAEDKKQSKMMVGYIEIDPVIKKNESVIYIVGIFVLPHYRRRKIGRDMLSIISDIAEKKKSQLRINAFSKRALSFWEEFGFKLHHYALYYESS
jgi:ribosomal protein S18 acetylase RimI-like enzyme